MFSKPITSVCTCSNLSVSHKALRIMKCLTLPFGLFLGHKYINNIMPPKLNTTAKTIDSGIQRNKNQ